MYLFLEDGLPTRPTGLFNHNGLYEINIPQASRVEITKGPGSALYGSDSIGGIVNVLTEAPPLSAEWGATVEAGSFGWRRGLFTLGSPISDHAGARLDVNLTNNKGYRDDSDYQRYSSTFRVDHSMNDALSSKTIVSLTDVQQSGVSSLNMFDYKHNPTRNTYQNEVGRRNVNAFRLSTEFSIIPNDASLLTITPYFRHNRMQLMPSWMLSYDPSDRDQRFTSYG